MSIPVRCPDCGASLDDYPTCQAIFESFLALEFSNPDYGKVHFLTVSCYMIQHNRYSDEALAWIEPRLREYLEKCVLPQQLSSRASIEASARNRTGKILRQLDARLFPLISWSMTIADVAPSAVDPQRYYEAVTQWGQAVLKKMAPLLISG